MHSDRNRDSYPTFVLIHGTFAQDAAWTTRDSPLVLALISRFPEARFEQFKWSGKNSHSHRLKAGTQLGEFLDQLEQEVPPSSVVLIAHSHGGNVALYSQKKAQRFCIGALICLATPFIECKRRDLAELFLYLRWSIPLQLCIVAALMPPSAILVIGSQWVPMLDSFGAVLIASLFGLGWACELFSFLQKAVDKSLRRWAERKQAAITGMLSPERIDVPVVVAAVARDEAGMWLGALAQFAEIPQKAWHVGFRALKMTLIAWMGVLALGVFYDVATEETAGSRLYMAVSLSVLLPTLGAVTLLFWLKALVPWVLRGSCLVFGGEGILYNLLVSIRPVVRPACASIATFLTIDVSAGSGLRHSRLHRDERFFRQLTDIAMSVIPPRPVG